MCADLPPDLVAGYRLAIEDARDLTRYLNWHYRIYQARLSLTPQELDVIGDYLTDQMRSRFDRRPT